jgi:hypothetical protein
VLDSHAKGNGKKLQWKSTSTANKFRDLIGPNALYGRFQDDSEEKEVKAITGSKFIRGVFSKVFWAEASRRSLASECVPKTCREPYTPA